jgi:hypothetical protein
MVENSYNRPAGWILVDIETGELKATEDYFSAMDTLFDTARASVIYGNLLDKAAYQAYLNNLYAITPIEYRMFYKELSI